jgi:subtilisin family serine protease
MRGVARHALAWLLAAACASPGTPPAAWVPWQPPPAPASPDRLRIEPPVIAARLGTRVELRLHGDAASRARCTWDGGESQGDRVALASPASAGPLAVRCRSQGAEASAEVTFTEAVDLPTLDPYAGGVVLFKARRSPRSLDGPIGTQRTGLASLDALLLRLGAHAFAAFPFDRSAASDRIGIDRWLAIDLPEGTNFYQAVALLRESPDLHAESFLAEDGAFLHARSGESWPFLLEPPRREPRTEDEIVDQRERPTDAAAGEWELVALGAKRVWKRQDGSGARIAIVDTGVDVNHLAISPSLRTKPSERSGADGDGNGLPGDESGVNFAHLAVVRGAGPPRLALGLLTNLSDWQGVGEPRTAAGHGTALAALAAGAGEAGARPGVAPGAEIIAIDVQENLRSSASRLIDEDPRMRDVARPGAGEPALRTPVWARALGVVYAVAEGADVITCAWPADAPHWLLHDALLFAEDNCAVTVCASADGTGFPVAWHAERRRTAGTGSGEVQDAWSGSRLPDFFDRPLRSMIVAGSAAPGGASDFPWPQGRASLARGVRSAVSSPRNDQTPIPDAHTAEFTGPVVATALVAGAAALVRAERPDLEPWAVRGALLDAMEPTAADGSLSLSAALAAAQRLGKGGCPTRAERGEQATKSARRWWERVKVRASVPSLDGAPPPASPDEQR